MRNTIDLFRFRIARLIVVRVAYMNIYIVIFILLPRHTYYYCLSHYTALGSSFSHFSKSCRLFFFTLVIQSWISIPRKCLEFLSKSMSSVNKHIAGSRKFLGRCTERDLLFIVVTYILEQLAST